jgi:hypothetical protein
MDRKDEIGAAKRALPRQERFELELAMKARDGARRDDRDEERGLFDRAFDLRFPQFAGIDRVLVLPQVKIPVREQRAEFALDLDPQREERTAEILVVPARVAEEADKFRKLR